MRIGVDLDDVLGDCCSAMVKWHNNNYGTKLKISDITTFNLEIPWKITRKERLKRAEEFLRSKDCGEIRIIRGAVK
jgi:5'(3')-deoxyribonucleotidase